jgi:hypothetical protein
MQRSLQQLAGTLAQLRAVVQEVKIAAWSHMSSKMILVAQYGANTHVWAGDVICPGCEHMFSVYRHELDQEQHVIDDKLRLAKEALSRTCRAHIASFRIP